MKRLMIGLVLCFPVCVWAQPGPPPIKDFQEILRQISADRISADIAVLASFGTRHTLSDTLSDDRGIGAARRWIATQFSEISKGSGGRLVVRSEETVVGPVRRVPEPLRLVNVMAELPGDLAPHTTPGPVLIVGAHYDSRASDAMDVTSDAPGANDDASGVAVVLELARVLAAYHFDRTILFVAFAGEEQGLLGSTALAEKAKDEGWRIEAMLNNDMVGNVESADGSMDSLSVRLFAEGLSGSDTGSVLRMRRTLGLENDGPSRTLARTMKEIGAEHVPELTVRIIHRRDRILRGGDHSPFHERGFAAVRFVESSENTERQHRDVRPGEPVDQADIARFVRSSYTAKIARLNAAVLATLANAPEPPRRAEIVMSTPVHQTTLRWDKGVEQDLAGYLVRVRRTTSAEWEQSVFTRDTVITLALPKDDLLFGVQSVDIEGLASLPRIPLPGR